MIKKYLEIINIPVNNKGTNGSLSKIEAKAIAEFYEILLNAANKKTIIKNTHNPEC